MNATELSELRLAIAEQHQAAAEHLEAANALTQSGVELLAAELEAERKAREQPLRCIFCKHESATLAELREHSATCEKHPAVIVLRESIGPVTPTKDTPAGYSATVRHHPKFKTLEVEFTTPDGGFVCFMEHLPELGGGLLSNSCPEGGGPMNDFRIAAPGSGVAGITDFTWLQCWAWKPAIRHRLWLRRSKNTSVGLPVGGGS